MHCQGLLQLRSLVDVTCLCLLPVNPVICRKSVLLCAIPPIENMVLFSKSGPRLSRPVTLFLGPLQLRCRLWNDAVIFQSKMSENISTNVQLRRIVMYHVQQYCKCTVLYRQCPILKTLYHIENVLAEKVWTIFLGLSATDICAKPISLKSRQFKVIMKTFLPEK